MRLMIDTSGVQFTVSREVTPRTDQNGQQRRERNTNILMWTVQLVAMDGDGAEVINVTVTASVPPALTIGQPVVPIGLQAIPWAQNGKNGVAYRVSELKPAGRGSKSADSAASSS